MVRKNPNSLELGQNVVGMSGLEPPTPTLSVNSDKFNRFYNLPDFWGIYSVSIS
jgi:hypothetical protein